MLELQLNSFVYNSQDKPYELKFQSTYAYYGSSVPIHHLFQANLLLPYPKLAQSPLEHDTNLENSNSYI